MTNRRSGMVIMLVAVALLVIAWLAMPSPAPPLYDGLTLPPQPYRYLQPPKGTRSSKPPASASITFAINRGSSPYEDVFTREQPPQVQVMLKPNAIRTPAGPAQITITIKPVPPRTPPAGTLDGNVYRIDARAGNGMPVTFRKGAVSIVLRGTGQRGSPIIEHYSNGTWAHRPTGQYLGTAIYTTAVTSAGDYALVFAGKGVSNTTHESYLPYLIIAALVVGLAVVGILLVRLARTGASTMP